MQPIEFPVSYIWSPSYASSHAPQCFLAALPDALCPGVFEADLHVLMGVYVIFPFKCELIAEDGLVCISMN